VTFFETQCICVHRLDFVLEIRSVERGICPIAKLYSLAAAYKEGRCKQGTIIFHRGRVIVKFVAMATGVGRGEI